jgi:hypothetical protein
VLTELMGEPPEVQLAWFGANSGITMTHSEWAQFYCESLEHKGLCCSSCEQDWEYQGYLNFDDHCCCEGSRMAMASSDPL